ncbi:MAG: MFS transporter [Rhodospirillales bacterium]|nr:MFS transporter [Rhodospirillales bacterium]
MTATISPTRLMAAGAVGNLLEWYDFAVYGYFAAAIGRAFFPEQDKVAQVLAAFGVFAVGFMMRPIGGALFGHVGDRLGRSTALTLSVLAMAVPTFLIGVLPGYDVLGLAAPVLLTLLRMLQGLSVGGEYTTSIIFLVERARPERRGVVGAVADLGAVSGILLGSATGAVLEWAMPAGAVEAWGWRIPFWIGLLVGVAGLVLRRGLGESAEGEKRQRSERPPLVVTFTHHWRVLAYLAGVSVFGAVGFYLMFVYIVSWLQLADGIPPAQALTINTISMALLIPAEIGLAALSDRIGRRAVLLAVTGLSVIAAWPLFWMMHGPEPWMVAVGQIGFVILVGGYYGCLPAFMVEAVPVDVRCTAIALGYNVALGLIGGLSPLAATWLVERTDNDYSPGYMIMAAGAISFLVLLLGHRHALPDRALPARS